MKVTIYKDKIINKLKSTAKSVFNDLGEHTQSYITEPKRSYPNTTIRQYGIGVTGKVATSPRDMVDSGRVRDSFSTDSIDSNNGLTVYFSWDAPYLESQYIGTDKIPPYPFVTLSLNSFDIEKSFKSHW